MGGEERGSSFSVLEQIWVKMSKIGVLLLHLAETAGAESVLSTKAGRFEGRSQHGEHLTGSNLTLTGVEV